MTLKKVIKNVTTSEEKKRRKEQRGTTKTARKPLLKWQ